MQTNNIAAAAAAAASDPPQKMPRRKKANAPPIPVVRTPTESAELAVAVPHQPVASPSPPAPPPTPAPVPQVRRLLPPPTQPKPLAGMQRSYPREYNRLRDAIGPIWSAVAVRMQFTDDDICNCIPMTAVRFDCHEADVLLAIWGDQMNHSLTELFVLLARQPSEEPGMLEAARTVRHLVPVEYHELFKFSEEQHSKKQRSDEQEKLAAANTSTSQRDQLAADVAKKLNVTLSDEENASNPAASAAAAIKSPADSDGAALIDRLASHIPLIPYDELTAATRNWSAANVLGAGGFGTVFHGRWKNTMVAIKRVKGGGSGGATAAAAKLEQQQGLNELRHLNSCRHDNILPLYGFSLEPNGEPCLVYKLMTGGSLEYRLAVAKGRPALTWTERMRVAIGTARGLQYLHTLNKVPIIHGDIKPANILLDSCCEPKIGDFGLTREGADDDADVPVSRVFGTRPYLPAEFLHEKALSTKVDTYSFGVVLLELATGLRAHHKSYGFLNRYVRQLDELGRAKLMPTLAAEAGAEGGDGDRFTFTLLMRLGMVCTEPEAGQRPEMVRVMANLEMMSGNTGC